MALPAFYPFSFLPVQIFGLSALYVVSVVRMSPCTAGKWPPAPSSVEPILARRERRGTLVGQGRRATWQSKALCFLRGRMSLQTKTASLEGAVTASVLTSQGYIAGYIKETVSESVFSLRQTIPTTAPMNTPPTAPTSAPNNAPATPPTPNRRKKRDRAFARPLFIMPVFS